MDNPITAVSATQNECDSMIVQVIDDDVVDDWEYCCLEVKLTDGSGDSIEIEFDCDVDIDKWHESDEYGEDEYADCGALNDDTVGCRINCVNDGNYEITIGYTRHNNARFNMAHEYETHTQIFSKESPVYIYWSDKLQNLPEAYHIYKLTRL